MKILAVATPGAGHINPMMPLIQAFLAQGDEVTVAAGDDPGGVVARTGASFHVAGRGEMDWFADLGPASSTAYRAMGSPPSGSITTSCPACSPRWPLPT
jgi:UDP:flavonoid glycosyltransferase YjiC (YdhE family)